MSTRNKYLFAGVLFLLLAIGLTFPLVLNLGSHYPSIFTFTGGDPNMYIWYAHNVLDPKTIFYPVGVNFSAGYDGLLMLLITFTLELIFRNPILAYNLFILFAITAAGLSMFWVIWKRNGSYLVALVCGYAFAFSPYIMVRALQHPNLLLIFPFPLALHYVIKYFSYPNKKDFWIFVAWGSLVILSSWYYALSFGLVLLIMGFLNYQKGLLSLLKVFATYAVLGCLVALPLLFSPTHGRNPEGMDFLKSMSLEISNLVIPHPFTFAGQFLHTLGTYNGFKSVFSQGIPNYFESTNYLGILGLGVLFWFVLVSLRKLESKDKFLLPILFLVFLVLALGPEINILGRKIAMPFALLQKIYPFELFRNPNRFFVIALIIGVFMFGELLTYLSSRIERHKTKILLGGVLVTLLFMERTIFPYPLEKIKVPNFYTEIGKDESSYAVADVPIIYPGFSEYNYFQITHKKPIVDGEFFYNAYDSKTFSYILSNNLLKGSICQENISAQRDLKKDLTDLKNNNIKFIVVHNLLLRDEPACSNASVFLKDYFKDQPIYFSDGEINVYKVEELLRVLN